MASTSFFALVRLKPEFMICEAAFEFAERSQSEKSTGYREPSHFALIEASAS